MATATDVNRGTLTYVPTTPGQPENVLISGGVLQIQTQFQYSGPTVAVATQPNFCSDFFNITGTAPAGIGRWFIGSNSDTLDMSAAGVVGYPWLYLNRTFGGKNPSGHDAIGNRFAQLNVMNAKSPVGGAGVHQMVTTASWFQGNANMGGTALNNSGAAIGSAYAFYPQVTLFAGATNYNSVSLWEGDIGITPTTETVQISGTIGTGDVFTATFTGSEISGSPVAVTYTVGAGNSFLNIVNGITAAVRANSALRNAGVSLQTADGNEKMFVVWPAQSSDITFALTTNGAGTITVITPAVSGASSWQKVGMSVVRGSDGATSAANDYRDVAISINDNPEPLTLSSGQWKNGILFGGGTGGGWPIAPTGTLLGAAQPYIFQVLYDAPFAAPQVQYGIDWHVVNFTLASGYSIWMPGFKVDGHGTHSIGASTITPSATGLAIDSNGNYGSGTPTIVNGGGGGVGNAQGNYFVGDILTDPYSGQYQVTGVNNSTGAVTSISVLNQPSATGSAPSNPVTTSGGTGSFTGPATAVTINITWTAATQVSLSPSGGNTVVGKQGAGATTDTGNHLLIPFCSGTPTGVPSASAQGIALRYDTSAHKLWAYDNASSSWKGVAFT